MGKKIDLRAWHSFIGTLTLMKILLLNSVACFFSSDGGNIDVRLRNPNKYTTNTRLVLDCIILTNNKHKIRITHSNPIHSNPIQSCETNAPKRTSKGKFLQAVQPKRRENYVVRILYLYTQNLRLLDSSDDSKSLQDDIRRDHDVLRPAMVWLSGIEFPVDQSETLRSDGVG